MNSTRRSFQRVSNAMCRCYDSVPQTEHVDYTDILYAWGRRLPASYGLVIFDITLKAVTVSLKGQIDIHGRSVSDPPVFEEARRWHYQEANPRWYVPDLDVRQNTSIQLEYRPTIFAPLVHGEADMGGYLSMFADECHCGNESAGFGNACAVQQKITFPLK